MNEGSLLGRSFFVSEKYDYAILMDELFTDYQTYGSGVTCSFYTTCSMTKFFVCVTVKKDMAEEGRR